MADRAAALLAVVVFAMLLALWNWLTGLFAAPESPWAFLTVLTMAAVVGLLFYVQARR